jgi:glycosyltransferase involved in cell wall biosynthesis
VENNKKSDWIAGYYVPNLVSVIIPTHNREVYLVEAVKSVINQTYRPIECIVVDDGSTDNTKSEVDKFNTHSDGLLVIKYVQQSNSGSQIARNTGTRVSSGEFVQYLDSDDLLYPKKIEKQVDFLRNNAECDAVFGSWDMGITENKEYIEAWESDDMLTQLLTEKAIHTLAILYRREIVNKIGEWDVNIKRNQEIDFQVRGILDGGVYKYQPHTCGLWRIHKEIRIGNSTGSKEVLHFFNKWEKLLDEKNLLTEKFKEKIANVLFWNAVQEIGKPDKQRRDLLLEAIRLDKNISFYNTPKMKLMVRLMGKKPALKLWLFWFKRHLN